MKSESHSVVSDSLWPHRQYSPWSSTGQNTEGSSLSLLQGNLPNPGIKPRSPTLQADSLPAEPQGKPKNTGVGSLFLLQWIFLTQKLNWGLLHCRQILYQLSYQGSPVWDIFKKALPRLLPKSILPVFSCRSFIMPTFPSGGFMALSLSFKCAIHFEFSFGYGVRK